jgi:hypothetical protein
MSGPALRQSIREAALDEEVVDYKSTYIMKLIGIGITESRRGSISERGRWKGSRGAKDARSTAMSRR